MYFNIMCMSCIVFMYCIFLKIKLSSLMNSFYAYLIIIPSKMLQASMSLLHSIMMFFFPTPKREIGEKYQHLEWKGVAPYRFGDWLTQRSDSLMT